MMYWPSRDGFLTALQVDRAAKVTVTAADDLCRSMDAIREHTDQAGIEVRVFLGHERGEFVVLAVESQGGRQVSWWRRLLGWLKRNTGTW